MVKQYTKGTAVKLSDNFKSTEFDCHGKGCCSKVLIDTELVEYCQKIRDHFGKAVTINSGYRCEKHNKAIGGAGKSKHVSGMAADIAVSGIAPLEVAKYAESIGVKGIGLYKWGCHIDTRANKAFWYSDKQEYRLSFGGVPKQTATVLEWQKAAISDGFDFPRYSADGKWGTECETVAKKAVCKRRLTYKYPNLTKLVQRVVGVKADGKFGVDTQKALKEWQRLNGFSTKDIDGVAGIKTYKKMLGV